MLGCIRSDSRRLAYRIGIQVHRQVAVALASSLPDEWSLEQFQCSVFDQGSGNHGTGSCEGHAPAMAIYTANASAGQRMSFVPSPWAIWTYARAKERALSTPITQRLPILTDTGVQTVDAIAGVAEFGVIPMGSVQPMAPDGRNSDVDASNVTVELDIGALVVGSQKPVIGAYGIDNTAPNAMDLVCASIRAGVPVQIDFYVDSPFFDLKSGQVAQPPNENDPNGGGHTVCCAEYVTVNGERLLRVTNSWGKWCDNGRFLAGQAWLQAAWAAHPYAIVGGV